MKRAFLTILITVLLCSCNAPAKTIKIDTQPVIQPDQEEPSVEKPETVSISITIDPFQFINNRLEIVDLSKGYEYQIFYSFVDEIMESEKITQINEERENQGLSELTLDQKVVAVFEEYDGMGDIYGQIDNLDKVVCEHAEILVDNKFIQDPLNNYVCFMHSVEGSPGWQLLQGSYHGFLNEEQGVCVESICFEQESLTTHVAYEVEETIAQDLETYGQENPFWVQRFFDTHVNNSITFVYCGFEDGELQGLHYNRFVVNPNQSPNNY